MAITDALFVSSGATEPFAPAAWSGATTYAVNDIVSVAASFKIYQSLAGTNLNHTPSTSPTWWRELGPTETAYNSGSTYALGDTVSSATTHRVYESLAAGNIGNPLPVPPETETTKWLDIGPTNRWAMFDLYRNTKTVKASPLTVVVMPGVRVNAVALAGLDATSVTISLDSSTGSPTINYYTHTETMNFREVANWYDYFFEPFSFKSIMALFDLPPYAGANLTITVTNTGGNAALGSLVIGSFQYIGECQTEAESDRRNFSLVDRDDFGNLQLIPRRSVPTTTQTVLTHKSIINAVRNLLTSLDAAPAFWSAVDDSTHEFFEPLSILGLARTSPITLADPYCTINLQLEEL